jgi:hypothetical protein
VLGVTFTVIVVLINLFTLPTEITVEDAPDVAVIFVEKVA